MTALETRCTGTNAGGSPCRTAFGLNSDTGLCLVHDPERADLVAGARSRGGQRSAELRNPDIPPAPRTLEEAKNCASWSAQAVAEGRLDPETARVYLGALKEFRAAYEKTDLERHLREEMAEMRRQVRELRADKRAVAP